MLSTKNGIVTSRLVCAQAIESNTTPALMPMARPVRIIRLIALICIVFPQFDACHP